MRRHRHPALAPVEGQLSQAVLALSGEGDATLLQQTLQRLTGLSGLESPLLICNEDHRFIVAEQMRQIAELSAILLEPIGRNTAPAVTVAALQATASGDDPLLLVLAADHMIRDSAGFRQAVESGRRAAESGRLVTFGIVPTAPETGYGYIEAAEPFSDWRPGRGADCPFCGKTRSGHSGTVFSNGSLHLEQRHVPVQSQRHAGGTGAVGTGCGELLQQPWNRTAPISISCVLNGKPSPSAPTWPSTLP